MKVTVDATSEDTNKRLDLPSGAVPVTKEFSPDSVIGYAEDFKVVDGNLECTAKLKEEALKAGAPKFGIGLANDTITQLGYFEGKENE